MADVTMPRLSDTMEEGTIASWLKKPGEQVNRGEVIAQIETDKAMMDLTAFEGPGTPGKVAGLRAKARQPCPTGPAVPPAAGVAVNWRRLPRRRRRTRRVGAEP